MAFRIGRSRAQHAYPQSPGAAGGAAALARNFAQGPAADQTPVPASPGTLLTPWNPIDSGATPGSTVPITPRVTGRVLVTGTIQGINAGDSDDSLSVQISVDGVPVLSPITGNPVVGAGTGIVSVSFCVLVQLIVGTTHHIGVTVSSAAGGVTLKAHNSTVSLQEVPVPTG